MSAALLLVACGPSEEEKQKAAEAGRAGRQDRREAGPLKLPTDATDKSAWQKYLVAQVRASCARTRRS